MMKIKYICVVVAMLFLPIVVYAESEATIGELFDFRNVQLPAEVQNLLNTADRVQEGVQNIPVVEKVKNEITKCLQTDDKGLCINTRDINTSEKAFDTAKNVFRDVDDWFKRTIGVRLGEIGKAIGYFFVWSLKWIVGFLENILSKI